MKSFIRHAYVPMLWAVVVLLILALASITSCGTWPGV